MNTTVYFLSLKGEEERMMKAKVRLCTLLLGVGLLLQSGCAALLVGGAAAGAGGYVYVRGEVRSTQNAPLDRAWNAAQAVMQELAYHPVSQNKDALNATLTARTADNRTINIRLKRLADDSTQINIRVGVFGDESLSRLILEKTEKELS